MNKIFIGGSRKVTHINKEVRIVIDKIIKDNCLILIGDANGVDKSIQAYLKNQEYYNIEVFCMENKCRNNIGSWRVRQISAARAKKDYIYYSTKDRKMAEEASAGLMVWDGKSFGTILNVYRLVQQRKKVDIYINSLKKLFSLNNLNDFKDFILTCTKELQDKIDNYNREYDRDISKQRNLFETTLELLLYFKNAYRFSQAAFSWFPSSCLGTTKAMLTEAGSRGGAAPMKTLGKLMAIALFFGLVFGAAPAVAGQAGIVSCATPGCDYHANLKIGGGMRSPSVTGYCRSTKKFVRVKLKSWDDYREVIPACPDCPEAILPIYDGGQVAEIPCPQCGHVTLHYKKTLMFD